MFFDTMGRAPQIEALRFYWLQSEFAGDKAATLTFYNGEVNSLDITDASGVWSVTGGKLTPGAAASGSGQPLYHSPLALAWAWQGGLLYAVKVNAPSAIGAGLLLNQIMLTTAGANSANTASYGVRADRNLGFWRTYAPGGIVTLGEGFAVDTDYEVAIVARPTAGFFGFINKKLVWVGTDVPVAAVNAAMTTGGVANAPPFAVEYARVRLLETPFNTDYGLALVNQASPVSGTDYTGSADGIVDATITAPNPLAGTTGIYYRHVDNNNTWDAYTDSTSGRVRLDSVDAGVRTNRISVNTVWAVGTTVGVRAIYTGQLHDLYTLSGSTWAKRGSQINVSVGSNNNTNVAAHIGGSYAVADLRQYGRSASSYSVLDAALA